MVKNSLKDKLLNEYIDDITKIISKYPEIYEDLIVFGEKSAFKTFMKCRKIEEKKKHTKEFNKKLKEIEDE